MSNTPAKPTKRFAAVFYGPGTYGPSTHIRVSEAPSRAEFMRRAKATAQQTQWRLVEIYPARDTDADYDGGGD